MRICPLYRSIRAGGWRLIIDYLKMKVADGTWSPPTVEYVLIVIVLLGTASAAWLETCHEDQCVSAVCQAQHETTYERQASTTYLM